MKNRFAKLAMVLALAVLCWTALRAFQPGGPAAEPAGNLAESVELPPEDLALLAADPALDQSLALARLPAAPMEPAPVEPAAASGAGVSQSPADSPVVAVRPDHQQHQPKTVPVTKPKRKAVDPSVPVAVDGLGRALLGWDVLAATRIDEKYTPTFPPNLEELDGKTVILSGFMSPLDEVGAVTVFLLLEFPVGCFYCQTPEPTGVILVELAPGTRSSVHQSLVKITGTLTLNRDDPEDFLYIVTGAEIAAAD